MIKGGTRTERAVTNIPEKISHQWCADAWCTNLAACTTFPLTTNVDTMRLETLDACDLWPGKTIPSSECLSEALSNKSIHPMSQLVGTSPLTDKCVSPSTHRLLLSSPAPPLVAWGRPCLDWGWVIVTVPALGCPKVSEVGSYPSWAIQPSIPAWCGKPSGQGC